MLRLTNVILPLDHPEADLKAAILARLKIAPQDMLGYAIFRRGYDARRKNAITLVYTLDVEVKNEAQVLAQLQGVPHVGITPDTSYKFVAQAPAEVKKRPGSPGRSRIVPISEYRARTASPAARASVSATSALASALPATLLASSIAALILARDCVSPSVMGAIAMEMSPGRLG